MPKIKANGIDLYYEEQGKGFPLVMITGLSASLYWWTPDLITTFARHFKVITLDNRGAGLSEDPRVPFTVKMMADDTVALMDALKVPKAHVLGISMGGMIAQELVLNYPDKVEKLVLCATTAGGGKYVPASPEVLAVVTTPRGSLTEEQVARGAIPLLFTPEYIKQHPDEVEAFVKLILKAPIKAAVFEKQLQAIMQFNAARRLKTVAKPTLVVHGKKDILMPPENGTMLAGLIPGAKLALFDEGGHIIFSPETAKVAQAIIDFLK